MHLKICFKRIHYYIKKWLLINKVFNNKSIFDENIANFKYKGLHIKYLLVIFHSFNPLGIGMASKGKSKTTLFGIKLDG
jgi:hypothetical protein